MLSADDFLNEIEPGRGSRLDRFKADILHLLSEGCTRKQIREFLSRNGVEVSIQTVSWFISTRLNEPVQKRVGKKAKSIESTASQDSVPTKSENTSTAAAPNMATKEVQDNSQGTPQRKKERELVEVGGRMIDVNYKPDWVPDSINLKDLI